MAPLLQTWHALMDWQGLAKNILEGHRLTRREAGAILSAPDHLGLHILQAGFLIREHYHGRKVGIHILHNAKSGLCPEDCHFCSQASRSPGGIAEYPLQSKEEIIAGGREAVRKGAHTYCIVTATRGPTDNHIETITQAVRAIKMEYPELTICCSLGILENHAHAEKLAAAGVGRFNHNLETSSRFYPSICSTHTFDDRLRTVKMARAAGMEVCCGGILGMGETREDIIDLAFALRDLRVDSIPVNFLDPRQGTPLEHADRLPPWYCLKILAMFRFANPSRDIRAAGGREVNLRTLQPLCLYVVNSIFSSGYLTTPGNESCTDIQMIQDMGFEVLPLPAP